MKQKPTLSLSRVALLCFFLTGSLNAWAFQAGSHKAPKIFKASIVKKDITPDNPQILLGYNPRTSTGVHDRIYHKIVVLDDGISRFFLVSSDICEFSPAEYDKVAARLKKEMGIARENFWWTVTHTHSAPEFGPAGLAEVFLGDRYEHKYDEGYYNLIVEKLVEGIKEANDKLVPARLGVGWGYSQANINRRGRDIDGTTRLGLNPDGPVDRRIGLIRIDKENGSPLALIANYAIHGTVLGGASTVISGDAPGIAAEYVEQKTGAPLLFINGAAGDLAPIYSVYPSPGAGHLMEFRVLLGDKILEANKKITTAKEVTLKVGKVTVETPRKEGLGWLPELKKYTKTTKAGEEMVLLPVGFLKINDDIAIWNAPLELFCEVSNEIRDQSPFPYTFYFGYSNGWLGYLPSESEWQYGGYETSVSPYTPSAAGDLSEAVLSYLKGELMKD